MLVVSEMNEQSEPFAFSVFEELCKTGLWSHEPMIKEVEGIISCMIFSLKFVVGRLVVFIDIIVRYIPSLKTSCDLLVFL